MTLRVRASRRRQAGRWNSLPAALLWVITSLVVLGLFAACAPAVSTPTLVLLPTETETPVPLPTDTIDWFPATATFTPPPTRAVTPTQEMRPQLGAQILSDTFTDQESWQVMRNATGSAAYGQDELTLAVSAARGLLISFRKDASLADFYLEIEAEPSLCRGGDAYGLLLRAQSAGDAYRLLFNCNGEMRFERLMDARSLPLHDWSGSGLPPGGMIPARIGVWALKDEMRVFVNDVYQFSVRDTVYSVGQVGVFARSAGDTPLSVSFSQLKVYAVEGGQLPLPSATPTSAPPAVRPSATSKP